MIWKTMSFLFCILSFYPAAVFGGSSNSPATSGMTVKNESTRYTCPKTTDKSRLPLKRSEALPFPEGAFVDVATCFDESLSGNKAIPGSKSDQKTLEKEKALKNLSLLLSVLYYQQKNLVGSYRGTDLAYQNLLKQNLPDPAAYDDALSNYEAALKDYGGYQAFLSVLPQAVSDYEEKGGDALKDFTVHNEDVAITLMKTPQLADFSKYQYELNIKAEDSLATGKEIEGDNAEGDEPREEADNLCTFMGAYAGTAVMESLVLVTLSNPLGAAIGAALGATVCSQPFYEKMTLLPTKLGNALGRQMVDMGSYIAGGLHDIGDVIYSLGREYLYARPAKTAEKIAEHYENTKSWLKSKLGLQ